MVRSETSAHLANSPTTRDDELKEVLNKRRDFLSKRSSACTRTKRLIENEDWAGLGLGIGAGVTGGKNGAE